MERSMEVLFFLVWLLVWLGAACIVGWVADKRGVEFRLGFALALFLSPLLGILILMALPVQNKPLAPAEPTSPRADDGFGPLSSREATLLTPEEMQFYYSGGAKDREAMIPRLRAKIHSRARERGIDLAVPDPNDTKQAVEPQSGPAVSAIPPPQPEINAFELAADEIDAGKQQKGLWAKAFADSEGDTQKQKALYLRYRADQLMREQC
jgi:hypothetical protein